MRPTEKQIEAAARIIYDAHPLMETDPEDGSSWYVTFDDVKNSYPATYEDLCERVAALSAALAVEAGTVGVKPLEWACSPEWETGEFVEEWFVFSVAGHYRIWFDQTVTPSLWHVSYPIGSEKPYEGTEHATIEAAKAAAQADYEARILSTLTTSPASSGVEGEVVAWRTMDSAPKDGTWIVARRPKCTIGNAARVLVVQWHQNVWRWADFFDIYEDDMDEQNDYGRYVFDPFESNEFTEWCPLPAAPTLPASSVKGEGTP